MANRKQQQTTDVEPKPEQTPGPHHVADEPVAEADSLGATL
jgi:hypothetical protein